jgi:CubicO group peptidase (beta-lactamase class C family)
MSLDIERLRARVTALLAEYGVPSAAIGVLQGGEITEFAAGTADVATGTPATTGTVYQIGSMTKTWTALAFMQLVDEGRAGLDQPVRDLLPGFTVADPETAAHLTPRHLLNHTNGIEESFGDPGEGDDVYERMATGVADAPQVFPLGRTHGYSAALGYALLGRILEVQDGKRWDDLMRDRLFDPLGLKDVNTLPEQADPARTATGHLLRSLAEGPIRTPIDHLPRAYGPGGTITSTVRDVLAMAHVLLNEGKARNGTRIVSPESLREMTHSRVPLPDPYMFGPAWGLGIIVCDWHGRTVYASDGSTIGQNARLRLLPDSGTAIVVLTNGGPRESFSRAVLDEILADLGAGPVPALPVPDPTLRLDPFRYVGVYERPGACFEVTSEGADLYLTLFSDPMEAAFLQRPERLRYRLLPIDETHFLMPPAGPLEDPQTAAIYDFAHGRARYLHTNSRVHPRVD